MNVNERDKSLVDYMPKVVFVKSDPNAQLPKKNNPTDTGYDVFATQSVVIPAKGCAVVPIGIKVGHIPDGYWFKVESRSGLGFKHDLMAHPGIIDCEYRGDCGVKLYNFSHTDYTIQVGDRCAQFVFYLNIDLALEFGESRASNRGEKGFGSSGK